MSCPHLPQNGGHTGDHIRSGMVERSQVLSDSRPRAYRLPVTSGRVGYTGKCCVVAAWRSWICYFVPLSVRAHAVPDRHRPDWYYVRSGAIPLADIQTGMNALFLH